MKWQNVSANHAIRFPRVGDLVMIKMKPWDNIIPSPYFIGGEVSRISNEIVELHNEEMPVNWDNIDKIAIFPKP